ncbi:hypothetical protein HDV03_002987 [Kappamyces sp. JEL0829]|nr:hypothetical protein HDV03_002987 [Kappamyces sp. JEL0829]
MGPEDFVEVECEKSHVERWRNAFMRIFELNMQPGEETAWHRHQKATVYICIDDLHLVEQEVEKQTTTIHSGGELMFRDHRQDKLIHKVAVVSVPIHIVGVEMQLLKPSSESPQPETLRSLPLVLSSDLARVYKGDCGAKITTQLPSILVALKDGSVQTHDTVHHLKAGQDLWLAQHQAIVLSLSCYIVEFL